MQTANGKAIVFGEHFVVYKTRAVAVAIEPGASATASPAARSNLTIPQWGFDARREPDADLGRAFDALCRRIAEFDDTIPPSAVSVQCHLPAGAGLGSSGAIGVATARALLAQTRQRPGVDPDELHDIVMDWESVFHGNPSGFDHAVSMRSGAVVVDPSAADPFLAFRPDGPLRFVIVVPTPGASTARMVEGVARFRQENPKGFADILESARGLIEEGIQAMEKSDTHRVGELMSRNHELLSLIGVSTPALDAWTERLCRWGAAGAKLTGAGGGGAVISLAPSESIQRTLIERARSSEVAAIAATIASE